MKTESCPNQAKSRRSMTNWLLTLAACLVVIIMAVCSFTRRQVPEAVQIPSLAAAEEAPGGLRKFLNYNGNQYVFLGDGTPYAVPEELKGPELGTLDHEIILGEEEFLHTNGAATFAVGGTIHSLTSYDPGFRIAVEQEGTWYLCERTDTTDGTPVDAAAYFETAHFDQIVQDIQILDHHGREVLKTISGRKVTKLLEQLALSQPAKLTDEQYGQIGQAQREGKSFLLSFRLNDGTTYEMYVIPALSISMLGNNRYTLPESFAEAFGTTFDKLEQKAPAVE